MSPTYDGPRQASGRCRRATAATGSDRRRRRRRAAGASSTNLDNGDHAAPDLKTTPAPRSLWRRAAGTSHSRPKRCRRPRPRRHRRRGRRHARRGRSGGRALRRGIGASWLGKSLVGKADAPDERRAPTVQQEYRYLHDVEALHGTAPPSTRARASRRGGGRDGRRSGRGDHPRRRAASVDRGPGRVQGLVERAANPNYKDPHTGQLVSFGRDVADVLGARTGGFHDGLSGALDACSTWVGPGGQRRQDLRRGPRPGWLGKTKGRAVGSDGGGLLGTSSGALRPRRPRTRRRRHGCRRPARLRRHRPLRRRHIAVRYPSSLTDRQDARARQDG